MKKHSRQVIGVLGLAVVVLAGFGCQQQVRPAKAGGKSTSGLQTVYFDYDRAEIRSDARSALQGNVEWLKNHKNSNVTVEGHCDERGSTEYNIALGWRRARSAKDYIVTSGVSASRLQTKSYGEERPVCTESTESCWSRNRRAEFRD